MKYTKAKFDAGCCTSSGTFHRRCICNQIAEVHSCRSICNADSQCKGYAIYLNKSCQIATTSNCPPNCKGPYQETNTQKLDYNSRCSLGGWSGGCAIKGSFELKGIDYRNLNFIFFDIHDNQSF